MVKLSADQHRKLSLVLLYFLALLCLTPYVSTAIALLLGVAFAVTMGNPFIETTRKVSAKCLTYSVVGLGAGMNLNVVASVGAHGIVYTAVGISATLLLGWGVGRLLGANAATSTLITVGTAICGGSAIAAVAPVIRAKAHDMAVALGTVFLLNSLALFIFPPIGHWLQLTQSQFGLWCALAIHDTSSVVGASLQFGQEALRVGTTIKLARALWIVPVTLLIATLQPRESADEVKTKFKWPWFILGFLLMAALFTWLPQLKTLGVVIEGIARKGMVLTLFLIGANLTLGNLKAVGLRPLIQGIFLWIVAASSTLALICHHVID